MSLGPAVESTHWFDHRLRTYRITVNEPHGDMSGEGSVLHLSFPNQKQNKTRKHYRVFLNFAWAVYYLG